MGNVATEYNADGRSARKTQRHALEREFQTWAEGYNLFLTFKFAQGNLTAEAKARQAVSHFWNKMDRVWFSSPQVRSGYRIPRICVLHRGSSGENVHIHALASVPDVPVFSQIADRCWTESDRYNQSLHAQTITDLERSCRYLLHEFWVLGSDTFLPEVSHKASDKQITPSRRTMSQLRRVLNAHYA
jgi:hypothetical protein